MGRKPEPKTTFKVGKKVFELPDVVLQNFPEAPAFIAYLLDSESPTISARYARTIGRGVNLSINTPAVRKYKHWLQIVAVEKAIPALTGKVQQMCAADLSFEDGVWYLAVPGKKTKEQLDGPQVQALADAFYALWGAESSWSEAAPTTQVFSFEAAKALQDAANALDVLVVDRNVVGSKVFNAVQALLSGG